MSFSKNFFYCKCVFIDFDCKGQDVVHPLYLDDYVQFVLSVIEKENLKNVTIVGHSFGGRVAIKLASFNKDLISLVLIDSAGLKPRFNIIKKIKIFEYKIRKKLNLNVERFGSADYKELNSIMRKTFINIVNEHLDKLLKDIDIPCLILWGNKDNETPKNMAHKLNRGLKQSHLVYLNGDHFAYAQDKRFVNILNAFFRGVYGGVN